MLSRDARSDGSGLLLMGNVVQSVGKHYAAWHLHNLIEGVSLSQTD